MGDEAMVAAAVAELRARGCRHIALLAFSPRDDWEDFSIVDEVRTRPSGGPLQWFEYCRWLRRFDALGIVGGDVLDGFYSAERSKARLRLAHVAECMGLRVALLGFSYRANPEASSVRMLREVGAGLSVLTRDPVSRSRVEMLARVSAIDSADLAFLLKPNPNTPRVGALQGWIAGEKARGRHVMGVNCNRQAIEGWEAGDAELVVEAYTAALAGMAGKYAKVSFVLMPHDSRGEWSDERLVRRLYEALGGEAKDRTYLVEGVWSAAEMKAAAGGLDTAITGRMHLAIACLGSGTPVASFEYQDKFTGLYQLFELGGLCVPGKQCKDAGAILELMERLYVQEKPLRAQIRSRWPEIQRLSRRNICALVGGRIV